MQHFSLKIIEKYVEENIGIFHQKRVTRLDSLKLSVVLKRKNPYLFRAKNVLTAVLKPGSSSTNKILDFLTGSFLI